MNLKFEQEQPNEIPQSLLSFNTWLIHFLHHQTQKYTHTHTHNNHKFKNLSTSSLVFIKQNKNFHLTKNYEAIK